MPNFIDARSLPTIYTINQKRVSKKVFDLWNKLLSDNRISHSRHDREGDEFFQRELRLYINWYDIKEVK